MSQESLTCTITTSSGRDTILISLKENNVTIALVDQKSDEVAYLNTLHKDNDPVNAQLLSDFIHTLVNEVSTIVTNTTVKEQTTPSEDMYI